MIYSCCLIYHLLKLYDTLFILAVICYLFMMYVIYFMLCDTSLLRAILNDLRRESETRHFLEIKQAAMIHNT